MERKQTSPKYSTKSKTVDLKECNNGSCDCLLARLPVITIKSLHVRHVLHQILFRSNNCHVQISVTFFACLAQFRGFWLSDDTNVLCSLCGNIDAGWMTLIQ